MRVIVATSADSILQPSDIEAIKRLQQSGYQIDFYYVLPKVDPQYTTIPSVNAEIQDWRKKGRKVLDEQGDLLGIPTERRHLADEILGPDRVYDDAKKMKSKYIITPAPSELRREPISRLLTPVIDFFQPSELGKEPTAVSVENFVTQILGPEKEVRKVMPIKEPPREEKVYAPVLKKGVQKEAPPSKSSEVSEEEAEERRRYRRS